MTATKRWGLFFVLGLVGAPFAAGQTQPVIAESKVHAYFDAAPALELKETEPLLRLPVVEPAVLGSAPDGTAVSCCIFGLGKVTQVNLADGKVKEYTIPFDSPSRELYAAGANAAWRGPDGRIYFSLFGTQARVGRFDGAQGKVELLASVPGQVMRHLFSQAGKLYLVTYPATLHEVDLATRKTRTLGRLLPDALYVNGDMSLSADGKLYCSPGERPQRKVAVDLASGKVTVLDAFPEFTLELPVASLALEANYGVQVKATLDSATVTIIPKSENAAAPITAAFKPSTIARDVWAATAGPDGRIFCTGSYQQAVYDPNTGRVERPDYFMSVYDYLWTGGNLLMCGYPNARVAVLDPVHPVRTNDVRPIWQMTGTQFNPRQVLCVYDMDAPDESPTGGKLAMKRAWSMAAGGDGRVYIANTGSRQNWGGALVSMDPVTYEATFLREPFRFLGIHCVCPIDGGRLLGLATAVSPDPLYPGKEPASAKVMVYDVAAGKIVQEAEVEGVKVLSAVIQAPTTRMLVGVGLPGAKPDIESDTHYTGNGEVFFYDMTSRKILRRVPLPFPIDRRRGRALIAAPDGTIWACGGGGLLRIRPRALSVEPMARTGAEGNLLLVGKTLYVTGSEGLKYGDASGLILGQTVH